MNLCIFFFSFFLVNYLQEIEGINTTYVQCHSALLAPLLATLGQGESLEIKELELMGRV